MRRRAGWLAALLIAGLVGQGGRVEAGPPAAEAAPAAGWAPKVAKPAVPSKPKSATGVPMSAVSYEPVAFSALPQWADDDHRAALTAFQASCPKVEAKAAQAGFAATHGPLAGVCKLAMALPAKISGKEARAFFEQHFQPNRVVHAATQGLLTGYYEPIMEGSRTRQGRFQTPILRRPADLVTVVPETSPAPPDGRPTHMRRTAAGLVPFPTRAEIEAGALAAQKLEILYLADPVEVFFLQIQGSGRVHLADGTVARVHYDGKNGHPYTSIGRYLIDQGLIAAEKMSMGALGRWLRAHPDRAREVMGQNASYVFFKEAPGDAGGPEGAIGVGLVAGRSLAVDPSIHRLGSPIYVSAPTLQPHGYARPINRLMVAHDVGSAIRGPERGDLFLGSGEAAARAVSGIKHPGNFFVLLPSPAHVSAPGRGDAKASPTRTP